MQGAVFALLATRAALPTMSSRLEDIRIMQILLAKKNCPEKEQLGASSQSHKQFSKFWDKKVNKNNRQTEEIERSLQRSTSSLNQLARASGKSTINMLSASKSTDALQSARQRGAGFTTQSMCGMLRLGRMGSMLARTRGRVLNCQGWG